MSVRFKKSKLFGSLTLSILLTPISFLYGIGVSFRNMLYDGEIIKPSKFSIPLISVGNLSIGGAGKTPHIEYLIKTLQPYIDLATLSRGYNRETTGFRFVSPHDTALTSGDEPLMYARKFQGMPVAVCENRAIAIPQMIQRYPNIQTVLLDDAFQHRSVQPYINILLTQYELPFTDDYLLPSGRLREWRSAYKRADIIIVSKCPEEMADDARKKLIAEIKPTSGQRVYFTKYNYGRIYHFYSPNYVMDITNDHDVIMISAIANTNYLVQYLEKKAKSHISIEYEDHHNFDIDDINSIIKTFNDRQATTKYILTTEKDAVRLIPFRDILYQNQVPIFVLPIEVELIFGEKDNFDTYIKERLLEFEA